MEEVRFLVVRWNAVVIMTALLLISAAAQPPATPDPAEVRDQIAKLLGKAVIATDLDEQIKLYTQILQLDPANANAFQGLNDAKQKKAQKEKDAEEKKGAAAKAKAQAEAEQQAREQAVEEADAAVAAGDLPKAETALARARQLSARSPELQRLDALVQNLKDYKRRVTYTVIAVAAMAVAVLIAVIWSFVAGRRIPYLQVIHGPNEGVRYQLTKPVTLVGSVQNYADGQNDIVLPDEDQLISRCHCEIHTQKGRLFLIDNNSSNKTSLNGKILKPLEPVRLKRGSRIDLAGVCELRLGFSRKRS